MLMSDERYDELGLIAKNVINLFAERRLTVADAKHVLKVVEHNIENTADVKQVNY